jgi:acyl carrier protein
MQRNELEQKVLSIIQEQKTLPHNDIRPETQLAELGIDSLDALNILFALEESFGISIPDDKARAIRTVDDMVSTIQELLPS